MAVSPSTSPVHQTPPSTGLIDSPLLRTVTGRPTEYWNDSCAVAELEYAVARGASGATSNPQIVGEVLKKERVTWEPRVRALATEHPTWTETELTWAIIEEMAVRGARVLAPVFEASGGRAGRLSLQVDPTLHVDADRMVQQAAHFATLAPNIQVKLPATAAGIAAVEATTARGINVNATVCFTVPQAVAVAEAVERGLDALAASGGDAGAMSPVVTVMIGRLDDWLRVVAERDGIAVHPDALNWAGIAAIKRAYAIFRERGYRARLLGAAYRHRLHWTELVGGNVIMTIPHAWQVRFNESGIDPVDRMDVPVDPAFIAELSDRFLDFRRAYEPDGLTLDAFASFGPSARTLRAFTSSYHELIGAIRDITLPNPDLVPTR
jgi:transaldolase